jgi:predicted PolB exonuclease-like 3'-5' exonuclease
MVKENYVIIDLETTGLRPQENIITCICAKDRQGAIFKECGTNEYEIISCFLNFLDSRREMLISANGKDFDIPFLLIRMFINNFNSGNIYTLLSLKHFDIINDITDRKISLNNLAQIYNFPIKTGNGLNAIQLFKDGNYTQLAEYCMNDVELTEKIYLKYLELKEKCAIIKTLRK